MKVNLIKEAEYELNESKCSKLPFNVFCKMSGIGNIEKEAENVRLPSMRVFASIEEFRKSDCGTFDTSEDVYVLPNGQFCIALKGEQLRGDGHGKPKKDKLEAASDEPTNTEEDKEQVP